MGRGHDPYDPYDMFDGGVTTLRRPAAPERRPASTRPALKPKPKPKPKPKSAPTSASARRPPGGGRRSARGNPFRRLRSVFVLFALLFMVVAGRLAQLQVVDRSKLEALGQEQRTRSVEVPADRGAIVDRDGNDLALSLPQPTVFADPSQVTDAAAAAAALAPILDRPASDLEAKLSGDGEFVYLARQVTDEVAEQVEGLALPGIHLREEQARFHPAGDLARSVLGNVNLDSVGSSGLELQYNGVLEGEAGREIVERDPNGRTIPGSERDLRPARPGDDIVVSIDRGMQYATEQALADQIAVMGAAGGMVVVSNPRTGEILSMSTLAVPTEGDDAGGRAVPTGNNAALTTVFEPGSVNKIITLAAALQEGAVSPTTHLDVPDHLQVADHDFTDHDPHPVQSWTPTDILATSSNIGTIMLARMLGPETVDAYLRRFGFGQRTALDFPNESPGIMPAVEDWTGTSIGSIPIGQGIAVTAMQMLGAFNVIANGGEYVAPKLVLGSIDAAGERHDTPPSATARVVSETTADAVRDMMVAVVENGTGQEAAIDGYSVAGKTGTARKPQPNGTYKDDAGRYHYVATFAGFVPAEDPQLSIIVVIDEPTANIYASDAAAPVFAELARYGLREFRIPPPAQALVSSVPRPTVDAGP